MRRRAFVLLVVAAILVLGLWLAKGNRNRLELALEKRDGGAASGASQAEASARAVPQGVPVRLAVPADSSRSAELGAYGFEGRVVSARNGEGIEGAYLTFEHGGRTWSVAGSADGAFNFQTEEAGRWLLAAVSAPGHLPFAPEWGQSPVLLHVRKGEIVRGITITLSPADEFEGKVVDPANNPVAGASITVLGGGAGANTLVPLKDQYRSDSNGIFRFVAPQDAVLEATHEGFARGRARIDYSARLSRSLTIRLRPQTAAQLAIDGTVVDRDGSPAEGALVSARLQGKPGEVPATSHADVAGRFQLVDLLPGVWILSASRADSAPAVVEVAAGTKGVLLRLPRGGELVGRVKEKRTGAPVAPFTVLVYAKEMRSISFVDPSGEYHFSDLAPGPAVVSVVAPGYAPAAEARVTVPQAGGGAARADFELSSGGRLSGLVLEQKTGKAIAGAQVEVEGTPPSLGIPIRNETKTDGEGQFSLAGLAEHNSGIQVSAPGYHARIVSVPPIPD
jgi:hypothetical protein